MSGLVMLVLKPMRRATKWEPRFVEIAFHLALLGADDKRIAACFGVSEMQLNRWKKTYPEMAAELKRGKDEADANVGKSLYQRALGYSHKAVKIFCHEGVTIEHEYIEHYPPDTTACIFWLKNRQPDKWRDQQVNVNLLQVNGAPNNIVEQARQAFLSQAKSANCGVLEGEKRLETAPKTPQEA